ncbi:MAG: ester cyclase [Actinomycetota bacterium]|nr:ester cyclase [Actinomycetota bacterium]
MEAEMADPRTVLERGIELWNAHDREGWVGLFDEAAELQAPGGIQAHGRAGAELFYDTWNEAFPNNTIEAAVVFGTGEHGADEARFTGTHSGTLRTPNGDIPATGRSVVSNFAVVARVRNDQLTSFHIYFDVAELLGQLGLMQ